MWTHYEKHGRHDLPWRATRDPYKILVSEVMLQQTQVERVIPFYKHFIRKFPTARALARAPLADALTAWQGLGYNRRAKMLRASAKKIAAMKLSDTRPNLVQELEALPGVGPYTARAVAAFAFNADTVFIETNIRTAVIHHFFPRKKSVSDKEIGAILEKALPKGKARQWYSALMDYGACLKRSGVKLNARSRTYAKQAKFKGSLRQVRGAILKALASGGPLAGVWRAHPDKFDSATTALLRDGLIEKKGRAFRLAR